MTTSRSRTRSSAVATFALLSTLVIGLAVVSNLQCAAAITQDFLSLTFFYHDNLIQPTGNSAFFIVPPLEPPSSAKNDSFGGVVVFDDSLTVGPDPSSVEIGRGRGIYVFAANSTLGPGVEFLWTAEFNEASGYGGSTLTFKGFDRFVEKVREIAIVGGTGKFRLARGWAEFSTVSKVGNALDSITLNITSSVFYGFG